MDQSNQQVMMVQNGSSHKDERSSIKAFFTTEYQRWSDRKGQDDSHSNIRGRFRLRSSSHPDPSQPHGSSTTGPPPPPPIPGPTLLGRGSSTGPLSEPKRAETVSLPPSHTIHGFDNEILSLKVTLLNQTDADVFKTVAVVGKYGVGKTALCQVVFNDEDVKRSYVPRVWVSMFKTEQEQGTTNDAKVGIVRRILENLGVEEETFDCIRRDAAADANDQDGELARLLYALYSNLLGKKYLIVLDDAREDDGWSERLDEEEIELSRWGRHLSYGFPKGSGGRVVITSRDERLAKSLVGEEHRLHRLYPLADAESVWRIYMDEAKKNRIEVKPRNEKKYREDLMNKSGGVPLAARMLGKNRPEAEAKDDEEQQPPPTMPDPINGQESPTNLRQSV